ncbi:MAG: nucleotidyl transferase AbiEii/AbiGii toxin family protein, partial [Fimbriimonadaceae bacterium]
MKDYFDVAMLAYSMFIDADTLRRAVEATFRRRKTELPVEVPICFKKEFANDPQVSTRWRAFVRKNDITTPFDDLEFVQSKLRGLLLPTIDH